MHNEAFFCTYFFYLPGLEFLEKEFSLPDKDLVKYSHLSLS